MTRRKSVHHQNNNATPSGVVDTWKLWRHCLCRHGWYPIVVLPFITSACLMDLYSSLSCEFMRVSVGFVPTNAAEWNDGTYMDVGFWNYQSGNYNTMRDDKRLINGCEKFSGDFEEYFIAGDKVWAAARIMSMASGISGLIGIGAIWLITICPLPTWFIWPGILLPAVLIGFIGAGAKFFFFDADVCQARIWQLNWEDDFQKAESCELRRAAYFAIGALTCYFISLILIFYRVPNKRMLDDNYGVREEREFHDNNNNDIMDDELEDEICHTEEHVDDDDDVLSQSSHVSSYEVTERPSSDIQLRRSEDDGVEAVMAQIGEFFKASSNHDYHPSDDPHRCHKRQQQQQRDEPTDYEMVQIELGRSSKSVEFESNNEAPRPYQKNDDFLDTTKHRDNLKSNVYQQGKPYDTAGVLVPSKSHRNEANTMKNTDHHSEERSSTSTIVSKNSSKSGANSKRSKSSQGGLSEGGRPSPFGRSMKENELHQVIEEEPSNNTRPSNSILNDLLSPMTVKDGGNRDANTPARRFRAY